MAIETTLSIIKPDAVERNLIGAIISHFEKAGLHVAAAKLMHMDARIAGGFYAEHKARPFFGELVQYMTSGPSLVMVLQGENAIARNREIMGATDPKKADEGTLRKLYGKGIEANAVHGSDSPASAAREISYFFAGTELVNAK